MTDTKTTPRVYVGTYAKYNAGSIDGAWVDLSECATYADFLRKCRQIHRNESDPEYMIQDCSGFPDGLDCLEWLSEQDFNDVKKAMQEEDEEEEPKPQYTIIDYSDKALAVVGDTRPIAESLKALGGRFNPRLSCGAGWIFSKRVEDSLRSLLSGAPASKETKAQAQDQTAVQCLKDYIMTLSDDRDKSYYKQYYQAAVRVDNGYLLIKKPSIENKFCFHDEGPQYDFYCSLMDKKDTLLRQYFLEENLRPLDSEIKTLESDEQLFVHHLNDNRVETITWTEKCRWYDTKDAQMIAVTPEERQALLNAYKMVRSSFEKRLQTYLKKYGTSKLHTWTYWADR